MGREEGARVSRREVLAAGSVAAGAAIVAATPLGAFAAGATEPIAVLPARALGRTGLVVGVLAGNASFAKAGVVEEAIAAGVNYWQDAEAVLAELMRATERHGRERLVIAVELESGGEAVRRVAREMGRVDVLVVRGRWDARTARAAEALRGQGIVRHVSIATAEPKVAAEALASGAVDIVEAPGEPAAGGALGEILAAARERGAGVILRDVWAARRGGLLRTVLGPYTSAGLDEVSAAVAYALAADGVSAVAVEMPSRRRLAGCAAAAARAAEWSGVALRRATA